AYGGLGGSGLRPNDAAGGPAGQEPPAAGDPAGDEDPAAAAGAATGPAAPGAGAPPAPGGWPPEFAAALDDDLGVPQALAVVHAAVHEGNNALAAGDTGAAAA